MPDQSEPDVHGESTTLSPADRQPLTWAVFRRYLWAYWLLADAAPRTQPNASVAREKVRDLVGAAVPDQEPTPGSVIGFSATDRGLWLIPNQHALLEPDPYSPFRPPSRTSRKPKRDVFSLRHDFRGDSVRGFAMRLEAFPASPLARAWRRRGSLSPDMVELNSSLDAAVRADLSSSEVLPAEGIPFLGPVFAGTDTRHSPRCWFALGTTAGVSAMKPPFLLPPPPSTWPRPGSSPESEEAVWKIYAENLVAYDVLRVTQAFVLNGVAPITLAMLLDPLVNWLHHSRDRVIAAVHWLQFCQWIEIERNLTDDFGVARLSGSEHRSRVIPISKHFGAVSFRLMDGYPEGWFLHELASWAGDRRCTLPTELRRQLLAVSWVQYDDEDVAKLRGLARVSFGFLKTFSPWDLKDASAQNAHQARNSFLFHVRRLFDAFDYGEAARLLREFSEFSRTEGAGVVAMRLVAAANSGDVEGVSGLLADLAASLADPIRLPRRPRTNGEGLDDPDFPERQALARLPDDLQCVGDVRNALGPALTRVCETARPDELLPLLEHLGPIATELRREVRRGLLGRTDIEGSVRARILKIISPPSPPGRPDPAPEF